LEREQDASVVVQTAHGHRRFCHSLGAVWALVFYKIFID